MIFLFPGQGVQGAGMSDGADPEVLREAYAVLGFDPSTHDLHSTRWAQPAIVACSLGRASALRRAGLEPSAVTGHSLGEYSALVVAGCLSIQDGLRLVQVRAEAMDEAARLTPGAMTALLGLDVRTVSEIVRSSGAWLAGDNAPGQASVSGTVEVIERVEAEAAALGGKARRIDTSGPFHSPAMRPAVTRLAETLSGLDVRPPVIPFWSSVTGERVEEPAAIRDGLLTQLVEPVRWTQTVAGVAAEHVAAFCDVGPGRVLAGLARRILPGADVSTADQFLGAVAL